MSDSANRPASARVNAAIRQVLERGGIAALATIVAGPPQVGAKILVENTGETSGDLGDTTLNSAVTGFARQFLDTRDEAHTFDLGELAPELTSLSATRILFERIQSEQRIVVFGAGHVGAALATLASFAGYRVTLVDDRAEFVRRELSDELVELWQPRAGRRLQAKHRNGKRFPCHSHSWSCGRRAMFARGDRFYAGLCRLIGSKRRTTSSGSSAHDRHFGRTTSQSASAIGLDIGAVTPEEVALAILAEIVAERGAVPGDRSRRSESPNPRPTSKVRRRKPSRPAETTIDGSIYR